MVKPVRIQLSRNKGFRLQEQSLSINGLPGRSVARPGVFGNPFVIGSTVKLWQESPLSGGIGRDYDVSCPIAATWLFSFVLLWPDKYTIDGYAPPDLTPLIDHNLACWCAPDASCHADVLLIMARNLKQEKMEALNG